MRIGFGPSLKSLEADFDIIELQQDKQAFISWAQSLRQTDPDEAFRTTDAVVTELAAFTLQRSMSRALPPGYTWKIEIDPERCRALIKSPSGKEWSFGDAWFGLIMHLLELHDWQAAERPPEPQPVAAKPFLFAEVDQDDPFERARAEALLKRMAG